MAFALILGLLTVPSLWPGVGLAQVHSLAGDFLVDEQARATLDIPRTANGDFQKEILADHLGVGPFGNPGQVIQAETVPFNNIPGILGAAEAQAAPHGQVEGFTGRCYASSRPKDGTAALFLWGTNDMAQGIAVFANKHMLDPRVQCAPSKGVHAGLATAAGLRLGMSREKVQVLLGPPLCSDTARDGYNTYARLPVTPELIRRYKWRRDSQESVYFRARTIVIWYKDDTVAGFSVEQHSLYD